MYKVVNGGAMLEDVVVPGMFVEPPATCVLPGTFSLIVPPLVPGVESVVSSRATLEALGLANLVTGVVVVTTRTVVTSAPCSNCRGC